MLHFATVGLSLPIILRGVYNILMYISEEAVIYLWGDHYIETLIMLNVIGTFVPVAF